MRTLVLGGARSGKSTHAEALAHAWPGPVTYVATSRVDRDDAEWMERIALHQQRRPAAWGLVETTDLASLLRAPDDGTLLLVDCLAVWITRMMDDCDIWSPRQARGTEEEARGSDETTAELHTTTAEPSPTTAELVEAPRERLQARIDELVAAVEATTRPAVFVTNEVGLSVVPEHWSGRFFRDQLGILNMRVAAACEQMTLVVAGIPMAVKQP